ncbi:MAG TPA: isochorismatase family cysteine hydrolase [Polyangiaceae bacterium]
MTLTAASDFGKSAPRHGVAVLLVDVINDFDFPEGDALLALASEAVPRIEALVERARGSGVPVIYVNDNFGNWRSDFRATVARCSDPSRPGAALVQRLQPRAQDYFVLKPKHSGFFHTPLELLLQALETQTVVICGLAANSCVTSTAHDAHMRGFRVVVPHDTTAANTRQLGVDAVRQLELTLQALTCAAAELDFEQLCEANLRR